jgi:AraC-like DNA-binding protein
MNNPLEILPAEKRKLRLNKIRLSEIHHHTADKLMLMLDVSKIRALELSALSEFQSIPSIGIRFAQDLISMGFYTLKDLKGKNPAKLTDRFERQMGVWIDPCLEDQFRLVVHRANDPKTTRNWWDYTTERKAFREKYGYPSTRPVKPWYELDQYKMSKRINTRGEAANKDVRNRLKLAVQYMNKQLADRLTLADLARVSHLSAFHFHRLFKSAYEATPLQFLTRVRLKKASKLLRNSMRQVSEVGRQCGFENESSFIRLFRREFKMTPLVFRKQQS